MGEFNFYDIYIPTLLIQALLAYVIFMFCGGVVSKLIAQGWIIFPNIFNLCFYLVLLLVYTGFL